MIAMTVLLLCDVSISSGNHIHGREWAEKSSIALQGLESIRAIVFPSYSSLSDPQRSQSTLRSETIDR